MFEGDTARSSTLSVLHAAIKIGYLEIEDQDQTFRIGMPKSGGATVHLAVRSGKFWNRVFRSACFSSG